MKMFPLILFHQSLQSGLSFQCLRFRLFLRSLQHHRSRLSLRFHRFLALLCRPSRLILRSVPLLPPALSFQCHQFRLSLRSHRFLALLFRLYRLRLPYHRSRQYPL